MQDVSLGKPSASHCGVRFGSSDFSTRTMLTTYYEGAVLRV